jgi:flagellar motor switch protein FliM
MTIPFDVRKPPPNALDRTLTAWLTEATRRAAKLWPQLLAFPAELRFTGLESFTASVALANVKMDDVAILLRNTSQDSSDRTSLLTMPRPLVLALLAGLMGENIGVMPEDRDLSGVESGTSQYVVSELFVVPIVECWPKLGELRWEAEKPSIAMNSWRLPPLEPVVVASFIVTTSFGEFPVILRLPRTARVEALAAVPVKSEQAFSPASRTQIEHLVREMSVDFSVQLGQADMNMLDLARLRAGDMILLEQKVNEPLLADVAGLPKFHVWPGAVGARHAVQIQDVSETD